MVMAALALAAGCTDGRPFSGRVVGMFATEGSVAFSQFRYHGSDAPVAGPRPFSELRARPAVHDSGVVSGFGRVFG